MTTATMELAAPQYVAPPDNPPVGGKAFPLKSVDDGPNKVLLDRATFEQVYSIAVLFSKSDLVPAHFRNKPDNCFIIGQLALRLGFDFFMMLQGTYVVHGRPGFEGKLIIALLNSSGLFEDPLDYEWEGKPETDSWAVTVYAKRKKTGKECRLRFKYATAVAEGWVKGNQKWKSMPDQMMMYRAAAFFARVYCPERLMGMPSVDELEDVGPKYVDNLALPADGKTRFGFNGRPPTIDAPVQPGAVIDNDVIPDDAAGAQTSADDVDRAEPAKLGKLNALGDKLWEEIKQEAANELGIEGEDVMRAGLAFLEKVGVKHADLVDGKRRETVKVKLAKWDWNVME